MVNRCYCCKFNSSSKKLHSFPTCEVMRKQWIINLRILKKVNNHARVCQSHFREEDYKTLNGSVLKENAVPSILCDFLPNLDKSEFSQPQKIYKDQRTIPMSKIDDSNLLKPTAHPCSSHEVDTDMVAEEDTDLEIVEELETVIELSSKEWKDKIALLEGEGTDVEMIEKEGTSVGMIEEEATSVEMIEEEGTSVEMIKKKETRVEMVEKDETSEEMIEEKGKEMLLESTEEKEEEMRREGSKEGELETSPLDLSIEESFQPILQIIPLSPTQPSFNSTTTSPKRPSTPAFTTPSSLPRPFSSLQLSCLPGNCLRKKYRSRGTQVKIVKEKSKQSVFRNILKGKQHLEKETVSRILNPNKKRSNKYTSEEIARGFMLRTISGKALEFVRKECPLYSFPSKQTLARHIKKYKMRPGLQHHFLDLLRMKMSITPDRDRNAVLLMDEMGVEEVAELDVEDDLILGPFKKFLVIQLRGIYEDWRQVIYVNFDQNLTKNLVDSIISESQKNGVIVRGLIFDNGNQTLLRELGISVANDHSYRMPNPDYHGKNIYYFSDVPHCVKLLRNHGMDEGYNILKDAHGSEILHHLNKKLYHDLLEADGDELRLTKLTRKHIEVKGQDRQKVNLALDMFSPRTAEAIPILLPENEDADSIRETMKIIDDWFTVFQSSSLTPNVNPLKNAFGRSFKEQKEALDKMTDLIYRIRLSKYPNRTSLLPFMKGIIVSNKSLLGLYAELAGEWDDDTELPYLFSTRCEQDVLECLFSMIRALGSYKYHPSPRESMNRLRVLMLKRHPHYLLTNTNVRRDKEGIGDGFLSANLMEPIDLPKVEVKSSKEIAKELTLNYVAGWTVRRRRSAFKHRDLAEIPPPEGDANLWIRRMSHGRLTLPSPAIASMVRVCNKAFIDHHGTSKVTEGPQFKREGAVKGLVAKILLKHPNFDYQCVHKFIRCRTFARIRFVNQLVQLKRKRNLSVRHFKQHAQHAN